VLRRLSQEHVPHRLDFADAKESLPFCLLFFVVKDIDGVFDCEASVLTVIAKPIVVRFEFTWREGLVAKIALISC
jgi:hypothetical protein